MAVIRTLLNFAYDVPSQVAVIEYNDTQTSAYFSPSITTIRQDTFWLVRPWYQ